MKASRISSPEPRLPDLPFPDGQSSATQALDACTLRTVRSEVRRFAFPPRNSAMVSARNTTECKPGELRDQGAASIVGVRFATSLQD